MRKWNLSLWHIPIDWPCADIYVFLEKIIPKKVTTSQTQQLVMDKNVLSGGSFGHSATLILINRYSQPWYHCATLSPIFDTNLMLQYRLQSKVYTFIFIQMGCYCLGFQIGRCNLVCQNIHWSQVEQDWTLSTLTQFMQSMQACSAACMVTCMHACWHAALLQFLQQRSNSWAIA